jgi:hypothetical protein
VPRRQLALSAHGHRQEGFLMLPGCQTGERTGSLTFGISNPTQEAVVGLTAEGSDCAFVLYSISLCWRTIPQCHIPTR